MKIITKDTEGRENGWLIPVWNALEQPELRPEQVYVTAIAPHSRKGPHLHMVRRGCFALIGGSVICWIRGLDGTYRQGDGSKLIAVAPGEAAALYNFGDTEAIVLNLPSPAWSKENPDDHPVTDWQDFPNWEMFNKPISRLCGKCGHKNVDHDSGGCCRMSFCLCQRFEVAQ